MQVVAQIFWLLLKELIIQWKWIFQ
jgi:hypothetical protein